MRDSILKEIAAKLEGLEHVKVVNEGDLGKQAHPKISSADQSPCQLLLLEPP